MNRIILLLILLLSINSLKAQNESNKKEKFLNFPGNAAKKTLGTPDSNSTSNNRSSNWTHADTANNKKIILPI